MGFRCYLHRELVMKSTGLIRFWDAFENEWGVNCLAPPRVSSRPKEAVNRMYR